MTTYTGDVRAESFNIALLRRPVRKSGQDMFRVELVEGGDCVVAMTHETDDEVYHRGGASFGTVRRTKKSN